MEHVVSDPRVIEALDRSGASGDVLRVDPVTHEGFTVEMDVDEAGRITKWELRDRNGETVHTFRGLWADPDNTYVEPPAVQTWRDAGINTPPSQPTFRAV